MITVRSAMSVPIDANSKLERAKDPATICTPTGTDTKKTVHSKPRNIMNSKGLSLAGICGPSCFRPSVPKECTADECFVDHCRTQLFAAAGGALSSTILQSNGALYHINGVKSAFISDTGL